MPRKARPITKENAITTKSRPGTLDTYLREIDESALLSAQEERDLGRRIIGYQDPEARDRMVRSNLRLVVNIAKNYIHRGLQAGLS